MRVLWRDDVLAAVAAHASRARPLEACGVLVGERSAGAVRVVAYRAARNRSNAPDRSFRIDPLEFARIDRDARLDRRTCVGVFHSHVRGPAKPSDADRRAAWADHIQLIAAPAANGPELRAYAWHDGRLRPIPVASRPRDR